MGKHSTIVEMVARLVKNKSAAKRIPFLRCASKLALVSTVPSAQ